MLSETVLDVWIIKRDKHMNTLKQVFLQKKEIVENSCLQGIISRIKME